jgi:hypothetical protein
LRIRGLEGDRGAAAQSRRRPVEIDSGPDLA